MGTVYIQLCIPVPYKELCLTKAKCYSDTYMLFPEILSPYQSEWRHGYSQKRNVRVTFDKLIRYTYIRRLRLS